MRNHRHWLFQELDSWLDAGLIEPHQAEAIRGRYPRTQEISWGRLALSALGSIVFGLGVILFFAYNWDDMPKLAKLGVIFTGLLMAHGGGYALALRKRGMTAQIEALHLLGTMLFGAGIFLISQIYHLKEVYPDPFFIWALAALAMAWALPSLPQAFAGLLLIVMWSASSQRLFLPESNYLATFLILLIILPLAYRLRSGILTFFAAGSLLFVLPFGAAADLDELTVYLIFFLAIGYFASRFLLTKRQSGQTLASDLSSMPGLGALATLGQWVYLVFIFIASFEGSIKFLFDKRPDGLLQWALLLIPLGLAIAALVAAWMALGRDHGLDRATVVVTALALALSVLIPFSLLDPLLVALAASAALLTHGVILVLGGSRQQRWQQVVYGCILVSAVTTARFSDLFDSLLARSMAFLVLGIALFAVGHYYQAHKKQIEVDHA